MTKLYALMTEQPQGFSEDPHAIPIGCRALKHFVNVVQNFECVVFFFNHTHRWAVACMAYLLSRCVSVLVCVCVCVCVCV